LRNKPKPVVHHLPITKARINLGKVARRVRVNKEYFILEKDGIPIVGIMGADELEDYLELHDPRVKASIRKSSKEYRAGKIQPAGNLLASLQKSLRGKKGAKK
jgi:hypothetical protein